MIGDEEVISLSVAKVYVFSGCVLCLGKMNENPQSNTVWEDKLTWFTSSSQNLETIDGEPGIRVEHFQGFTTLQLSNKSPRVLVKKRAISQKNLQDHLHVDVQRYLMVV